MKFASKTMGAGEKLAFCSLLTQLSGWLYTVKLPCRCALQKFRHSLLKSLLDQLLLKYIQSLFFSFTLHT